MYLSKLKISGFRKLNNCELEFQPGLNILVGPNNIGKTTVIDALRALLATEDGTLRLTEDDLYKSPDGVTNASCISFQYIFCGLSLQDEADFFHALSPCPAKDGGAQQQYEVILNINYSPSQYGDRLRGRRWCSNNEEVPVSNEMLENLRTIYLQPLRDPEQGLRPGRNSQLAKLIHILSDETGKQSISEAVNKLDEELQNKPPIAKTQQAVTKQHLNMVGDQLGQSIKVGLTQNDFKKIASRLSMLIDEFDVYQNGLGFNNLIYMAVSLGELTADPNAAYKSLIIEEPEAHLHPQLQVILLQYLENLENDTSAVQIFVTSHSPNFASSAKIDSLIALYKSNKEIKAFLPRTANLDNAKKHKLERYLDATKAALFFADKIIFVEGIVELLLIPIFAEKLGYSLKKYAVSVISVDGLNFDCFLPLFGENGLDIPVAVITDSDPGKTVYPKIKDPLQFSNTANIIQGFESGNLKTFFAQKTFEYDLCLNNPVNNILLQALSTIHPKTALATKNKLDCTIDNYDKSKILFNCLLDSTKKGEYAQALAGIIENSTTPFNIPKYLEDAIRYICTA
jgi:putative ATP-dependent endonuclease of OLD family